VRNIPSDVLAEYTSGAVKPQIFIEMFFKSGTLRLWTGYGIIVANGEEFTGAGTLIGFSPITETQDIQAKGLVVSLNGMKKSIISLALQEKCSYRPFRMYLGFSTAAQRVATEDEPGAVMLENGVDYIMLENNLTGTSLYRNFSGLMDTIEITHDRDEATVRLSVENILLIGRRAKVRRYTSEDQKKRYPNDKGLDFINQLQDKELVW
jgi:hypothetical protein